LTLPSRRRALALATALFAFAAPAAHAACEGPTSKPFSRYLDFADYVPVPGGDFEGGDAWSLNGASVVSSSGDHSLSIPRGASATSPAFCGGVDHPTVRLFAKGGGLLGLMQVTVNYTDGAGLLRSQPLGLVLPSLNWQPSLPLLTLSGLPLLTGSQLSVTLTAISGNFQVDDVYVDPWMRH
jgi:hypothetical protein